MYNGEYSLTFRGANGNTKNTWTDWSLIPESPPVVSPPQPVTNLVDIPGRKLGPIDLSTAVFGKIVYQRVTGTWNFLCEPVNANTRKNMYETVRKWLHGRLTTVVLAEDPNHCYKGRFTVSAPTSNVYPIRIAIGYDLEPVRYALDGVTLDTSYLSDWTE